jgi:pyruvate/2-oxoglutarate dehydrogenase complex dihydrolipoamide dehydrogenase (E3) component
VEIGIESRTATQTDALLIGSGPAGTPLARAIAHDERGFIATDDQLPTNVPGVYALGDVRGGPAITHISHDDFRIIRTNLIERGTASVRHRLVRDSVFIDPPLGRVGLTESEALVQKRKFRVARLPMSRVARAREVGEACGFMKAVVDATTVRSSVAPY